MNLFIRYSVLAWLLVGGLSGCASLFDMGSDETSSADYDRGYSVGADSEEEDDGYDRGSSVAKSMDGDESSYGRRPAASRTRHSRAIQSRDVVIGMTRGQVLQSWGEPSMRESAGRGTDGHERWTYRSRVTLGGGERVVIFENGRVAGWYR